MDLARTLFLHAAKENPESPEAAAGLGDLALAEHRDTKTRSANWNAPSPWGRATPTRISNWRS